MTYSLYLNACIGGGLKEGRKAKNKKKKNSKSNYFSKCYIKY